MANKSTSSGLKTADGIILNGPGTLTSLQVTADGSNAAEVILYDNASAASGIVLAKVEVDAGTVYEDFTPVNGIVCNNGIYLDINGTNAECVVHYERG